MLDRIQALAQRAQQTLPARVLMAYGESQAGNYALAVAFAGFMSMFPMILGALSIIGLAIRDPSTEAHFQLLVVQMFPASARPELERALDGVKQSAGVLGLVSLGGLIWSASSMFGTIEFALTKIFGTRQRGLLRQRLMGFVMMLVLVVAIVLTVLVNVGAAFIPVGWAKWIASFIAGAIMMVALLVALYRFVPNHALRLGEVLPGALLAGVLIEALSLAFPLYVRIAGEFNTYGAQFALLFLLATWFYLLSQLVLLGAVYNRCRMGEPAAVGQIANPAQAARSAQRRVEAIERQEPQPPPPARRRSWFQAGAILVLGSLVLVSRLVKRKRVRTAR